MPRLKIGIINPGSANPHLVLEQDSVVKLVEPAQGDLILDAACGTGRFSQLFVERGANVIGIDFSEKMLAVARINLPNTDFCCVDLTNKLPFADSYFDKINCAQVLEHIEDISTTFVEFARVLKPNGTAIILEFSKPKAFLIK